MAESGCKSTITYNSGESTACIYTADHEGPHCGGGRAWTLGGSQAGRQDDLGGRPGKAEVASGGDRDATSAPCEEVDGCCFTHGPCFRTQHDPLVGPCRGWPCPDAVTDRSRESAVPGDDEPNASGSQPPSTETPTAKDAT